MSAQHTGPYWVRTNTDGTHDVCGKNAKVVRHYPASQEMLAGEDCRRLQGMHLVAEERVRRAAPDLLAALQGLVNAVFNDNVAATVFGLVEARAAIASALGEGEWS